jgi:hypothetical protein
MSPAVNPVLHNSYLNSTLFRHILSVTVRVSSETEDAVIRCTKDGTTPTAKSQPFVANAPNLINTVGWVTIKCLAFKDGMESSDVTSMTYHILDQCAKPIFLPAEGTYEGSVTVVVSSATPQSKVCYNVDASEEPTETDLTSTCVLSGKSFILDDPGRHTIKAIAFSEGVAASELTTTTFHILAQVATPIITPAVNTFPVSAMLTITCSTPGATIYYTLDGSDPTLASLTVDASGVVVVNSVGRYTLKAVATEASMLKSTIATKVFQILPRMSAPELYPPPGAYVGQLTLSLRCSGADDDAVDVPAETTRVYYTTDGISTPTEAHSASVACGGTIILAPPGTVTVRAIADGANVSASSVTQGTYTLKRAAYETFPVREAPFSVQPELDVIVVAKELPDYCKRNVRGRLVVLHNPQGHFDVVPPLEGCGAGVLELPSVSGRRYQPVEGFNLTSYLSRGGTNGGGSSPVRTDSGEDNGFSRSVARRNLRRAMHHNADERRSVDAAAAVGAGARYSTMEGESDSGLPADLAFTVDKANRLPHYLQQLLSASQDKNNTAAAPKITLQLLNDLQHQYENVDDLGCQLVTNAGFFNTTRNTCIGDLIGGGNVYQLSELHNVNFGMRNGSFVTGYVTPEEVNDPTQAPFEFLISGLGWLVRNGQSYVKESFSETDGDAESMAPQTTGAQFLTVKSARTALGHDAQGNLMILQVEGETWIRGMNLYEFADFAAELGFVNAINLDGGGSATMTQNHTLVSEPSWKCVDPPYNSSAYYRCEKRVSSITCIHAMRPPFIDAHYLQQFAHSAAPTIAPSVTPTQVPTFAPTEYTTAPPTNASNTDDGAHPNANVTAADMELAALQKSRDFYELSTVLLLVSLLASVVLHLFCFCAVGRRGTKHDATPSMYGGGPLPGHAQQGNFQQLPPGYEPNHGVPPNEPDPEVEMTSQGANRAQHSEYQEIGDAAGPYAPLEDPRLHFQQVQRQQQERAQPSKPGLMLQHETSPNNRAKTLAQQHNEYAYMDAYGGDAPRDPRETREREWAAAKSARSLSGATTAVLPGGGGGSGGRVRTMEEEAFYETSSDEADDMSRLLQDKESTRRSSGGHSSGGGGHRAGSTPASGAVRGSSARTGGVKSGATAQGMKGAPGEGSDDEDVGIGAPPVAARKGLVSKTKNKKGTK